MRRSLVDGMYLSPFSHERGVFNAGPSTTTTRQTCQPLGGFNPDPPQAQAEIHRQGSKNKNPVRNPRGFRRRQIPTNGSAFKKLGVIAVTRLGESIWQTERVQWSAI
jgi:hypothetical protein